MEPLTNYDEDIISLDVSGAFSDADLPGDTLSFSATGLPAGLSMSTAGVISGTIDGSASDATDDDNNTQDYNVVVTVTDGEGGLVEAPFTWTVNNTLPEFLSGDDVPETGVNADSYSFSADEGTAEDDVIGQVAAVDADNDSLTYSITGGNESGLFAIDANSGEISVTQDIDDAELGSYSLSVLVDDGEGGQDTASVAISLDNINDDPAIVSTGSVVVSEEGLTGGIKDSIGNLDTTDNAFDGSGQVVVTDIDGGAATYTLDTPPVGLTSDGLAITWSGNGTEANGLTGATQLTGATSSATIIVISIAADGAWSADLQGPIDHPSKTEEDDLSFDIGVTVSDGNGGSDTATLSITVEDDSPDAAISFVDPQQTALVLSENADSAAVITFNLTTAGSGQGADGANSVVSLSVDGLPSDDGGFDTGLKAVTGVDGGESIYLYTTLDPAVLEAKTSDSGPVIFSIALSQTGDSLTVTVPTMAIYHDATLEPSQDLMAYLSDDLILKAVHTMTDADLDVSIAEVDLSGMIGFTDGVPVDNSVNAVLVNEANTSLTGQSLVDLFADGVGTVTWTSATGLVDGSAGTLTSNGEDIVITTEGNVVTGTTSSGALAFTVTAQDDGTYDVQQYLAIDTEAPLSVSDAGLTYGSNPESDYYMYQTASGEVALVSISNLATFEADNPNSTLIFTLNDGVGSTNDVNMSAAGIGGDANNIFEPDVFQFDLAGETTYRLDISFKKEVSLATSTITATYVSGDAATPIVTLDADGLNIVIEAEEGQTFDAVILTSIGESQKITDVTVFTGVQDLAPTLTLGYEATDGDLDSASGSIDIAFTGTGAQDLTIVGQDSNGETLTGDVGSDSIQGLSGDDILSGLAGDDVLIGGAGNDILTGGAGDDIFLFTAEDQGTGLEPATDSIVDFNDAGEADVLDISDLLVGEAGQDLTAFLEITETLDGAVQISVTPNGSGDVTEVIRLEGTTLAELGADAADTQTEILADLVGTHIIVDS